MQFNAMNQWRKFFNKQMFPERWLDLIDEARYANIEGASC